MGTGSPRENTIAAFTAALSAGADGVELDVRRCADGVAVVSHDPVVEGAGPIHLVPRSELPAWVPTLEEALACCAGAYVDVELKSSPAEPGYDPAERMAGEVAEMVAEFLGRSPGPAGVVVSCFWPGALQALRRARPELTTGLLVAPGLDPGSALDQAGALGAGVLLPFRHQATSELVESAHRRNMAVVPWAVDDEGDLRAAVSAGADALVTDEVRRALAVVGR